jgi:hypothetical protein
MTQRMLNTRIPLIDVIAVAGTFVLKIFLVLRTREKHKNTSQKVAEIREKFCRLHMKCSAIPIFIFLVTSA